MRKYHCKASIMLDLLFLGNNSKTGDLTVIDVKYNFQEDNNLTI